MFMRENLFEADAYIADNKRVERLFNPLRMNYEHTTSLFRELHVYAT